MKKIYSIIAALVLTVNVFAQAPEKMSYQAVIRDAGNTLVTSQAVGMQISILQGSVSGTAVYVETQTPTTNINGLVSIEIGSGSVVSGSFSRIHWSAGPYFIKTETDPSGGTNYSITGTSQLMSVPYALYAKSSGSSTPGPQGPIGLTGSDGATGQPGPRGPAGSDGAVGPAGADGQGGVTTAGSGINVTGAGTVASPYVVSTKKPTYTIGLNAALGGYVFYVTPDGKHGLVAETQDQSSGISSYGAQNSISDPANHSTNGKNFTDWRLPTKYELNQMYLQREAIGGFAFHYYWSSTEADYNYAWLQNFYIGTQDYNYKFGIYDVRAVRAF